MKNYKFTKDDIILIQNLYKEKKNATKVAKQFCLDKNLIYDDNYRKNTSNLLLRLGITKKVKKKNKTPEEYNSAKKRELKTSKYYIVTWEQNNTPIHQNLWKNILKYKEYLGAELSVILGRYKNPTSIFSDKDVETWNEVTRPYWDANRHDIHPFLTIISDVKVQPTATNPLTGLESMTGETTTIVGHPKMWLKSVPVLEGHPKKILLTTGAITVPNYVDSKAGKRGEMHHKLGFVIVEVKDDDVFFIRQVEADEHGNFIDLFHELNDGELSILDTAEALVWGDTHVNSLNIEILEETVNIIGNLKIPIEIHHDLADGVTVNNHIEKNPVEQYKRMIAGDDCIEKEIADIIQFLGINPYTKKIVVQANHNDRFDRWINSQDWKKDLKNALPYLKYTTAVLEGKAEKGVLTYLIENQFTKDEVFCLDYDDSYMIGGYEVAHHGHIGANGSRGSVEQFRKMSTKMIIGHSHSPARADGIISVGTSSHLREGYNKGASSWLNAHAIIHKNNTVQHLIFVRGEFTTFKI